MYFFIFVICIILKCTDSAVLKNDQILKEVIDFASSEKVTDIFAESPGFLPKEFGNKGSSRSALKDISFELVSNLSDESSDSNKRSKKVSNESEDSTETESEELRGRNIDNNISFEMVPNEGNKRSKMTSELALKEHMSDSSESMTLESESDESTESFNRRNILTDISFELVPSENDFSVEGNKRRKKSSSSSELIKLPIESEESKELQIDKYGIIDNDQVFCSWEDVKTRDQMAQKLKTEKCRFSMAHQSIYEGGPNVTMFCTYKTCRLAELNDKLSRIGKSSRDSWLSNLGFGFDERDDEIMYCIHNDWRARNMIAHIEKTSTNCMFAKVF